MAYQQDGLVQRQVPAVNPMAEEYACAPPMMQQAQATQQPYVAQGIPVAQGYVQQQPVMVQQQPVMAQPGYAQPGYAQQAPMQQPMMAGQYPTGQVGYPQQQQMMPQQRPQQGGDANFAEGLFAGALLCCCCEMFM